MQSEPLRYERKFLITDYSYKDVEHLIKFHPACFKEIFHERTVNNIYLDTPGMASYFDNVEGEQNREKVRIRWYGDLFGRIEAPVLEYKIKKGLLGKKMSFFLNAFELNSDFHKEQIEAALNNGNVPIQVKDKVSSLRPVLLNSYVRRYFLSANQKFRVTIDHQLTYFKINYGVNTFLNKVVDVRSTVLELKYDSQDEVEAKEVGSGFPFMLTKNSKYVSGLESVFLY